VWADADLRPLAPIESFLQADASFFTVAHTQNNKKWKHVYQACVLHAFHCTHHHSGPRVLPCTGIAISRCAVLQRKPGPTRACHHYTHSDIGETSLDLTTANVSCPDCRLSRLSTPESPGTLVRCRGSRLCGRRLMPCSPPVLGSGSSLGLVRRMREHRVPCCTRLSRVRLHPTSLPRYERSWHVRVTLRYHRIERTFWSTLVTALTYRPPPRYHPPQGTHQSPDGIVQLLDMDISEGPTDLRNCLRLGEPCSVCYGTTAVADCRYPPSVWERDGVGFHKSKLSELDVRGGVVSGA
jgi:hypothetical protein